MKDTHDKDAGPTLRPFGHEDFLANIVCNLVGSLEEAIGVDDANGFVAIVGDKVGNDLTRDSVQTLNNSDPIEDEIHRVCDDLKKQIGGGFQVEDIQQGRITLSNCSCPFGENVKGRHALCMVTTSVVGRLASNAFGYARVQIEDSIAAGNDTCRIVVHVNKDKDGIGHEFFR